MLSFVSLDRAKAQYFTIPPMTLKINANGGFTVLALVRFTGTPGRIFIWSKNTDAQETLSAFSTFTVPLRVMAVFSLRALQQQTIWRLQLTDSARTE
jgi:hypothetical protein